jgi:putative ABC transport system permease protein
MTAEPNDGGPERWLAGLWQDVRYAARTFSKQPAFAGATVLTLALGIGASAAIFSVVYGVMLKPLPFPDPGQLVHLGHRSDATTIAFWNQGPATYFTALDHQRMFEQLGAWESNQVSITGRGDPERVEALVVTHTMLALLRVRPMRGRAFTSADDAAGSPLRVMLSHGYWQRRFGGADAIGQTLQIDGAPAEIIGVLPSSFKFLRSQPAIVLPLQLDRADAFHIEFDFEALGRMKTGVTLEQANSDMARWIGLLPDVFDRLELKPYATSLSNYVTGDVSRVLWILLAAVGIVLLIACGNVANLFLVRAEGRQQEFAMRAALGASRARIARGLLSESVVLALAGGAIGLVFAQAAILALRAIAPAELPRIDDISINPTVLLFTLVISLVSGVLFGLAALLRFGKVSSTSLKEGGRSSTDAPGRLRVRNALVVAQVALALMLLIVSGLMIRTFIAMRNVQPGFTNPEQVQTFRVDIPDGLVGDDQQAARMHQSISERLARVPGVDGVGLSSSITMDGEDNGNPIDVEELPRAPGQLPPLRRFKSIAPGYVETMGNRMVAGRSVTWTDILERRPVIVLSEPLAREYWNEPARAIGKRVRQSSSDRWREVIGVTAGERDDGLNHPPTAIVYWPMLSESYGWRGMAYAVRSTRVGTAGFVRELQQAVWSVNPNLPLDAVQTLDDIQAFSMAQTSFAMVMLAISASVALLLGVVGIYAVIAYVVAQRTREIGIRMALGARTIDVRGMFVRQALWLTMSGVAIGISASLFVTNVMSSLLFGVGRLDPLTYVAVSAALTGVALLATHIPARRAAKVDPIIALRADV